MLREKVNRSLRFKFLIIMTGILLTGTLAISLVIMINEGRTKKHSLMAMGQSFASYIAKLSADALIINNNIQLDAIVADANNDENIAYTIIYDEQGNPVTTQYASINYRLSGIKSILLGLPKNTPLPDIIKAIQKKEPIIEVSSPINMGLLTISTKRIGTVTVGMSEYKINQAMMKTILIIIGFNICILMTLGAVLFISSKTLLIDPIIKLAQASSLLAKGDLKAAVEMRTTGEVKTLVDSFNEMVRNLDKVTVSRDYVDNIIRSMINTLIVVSPDYKIMSVNRAACKLLGYEEKEIISRPVEMVFDEEKSDREARMTAMFADGYIDNIEVSFRTQNGRKVPVLLSGTIMRDEHQVLQGIIYVGQDITERKQAEEALRESEERYRTLVELAPDIIYRLDEEGRILFISSGVTQLGYQPEDLVGRKFEEIVCPEDRQRAPHSFVERRIGERAMKNLEIRLITKEGDLRDYSLNYHTFSLFSRGVWNVSDDQIMAPEKKFIATQGIARDISDLKEVQAALTVAKGAAEAANRAKSDFLASMSHELRTPLNAIIGFSEVLQDHHFGALNEKQSRQINHILSSGRHLLSLINDILDLAKVESGKIELELSPVRIAELIKSSLVMIKEKALKHQLQLQEDLAPELTDLTISADERKLKQIMFNLLSNAAKYTPDEGEIKVVAMREAGNLVISVSDTGIGIAPEDQERIFGAFEQVDSSYTRQQEGTGLGLGLTRRMVELHGGRIWVESAGKDRGSSFTFTIPIELRAKEAAFPEKSI